MKIDVVYALGDGSRYNNNELRFSLRSLLKHAKDLGNIYIAGKFPNWLKYCTHIKIGDPHKNKDANLIRKVLHACDLPEISDPFMYNSDDQYLSRDTELKTFPYYYKEKELVSTSSSPSYRERIRNTGRIMRSLGCTELNYDAHAPFLVHKESFRQAFSHIDWIDTYGQGVTLVSAYVNQIDPDNKESIVEHKYKPSCALSKSGFVKEIKTLPYFSTYPQINRNLQEAIEELYPEKLRFEINIKPHRWVLQSGKYL